MTGTWQRHNHKQFTLRGGKTPHNTNSKGSNDRDLTASQPQTVHFKRGKTPRNVTTSNDNRNFTEHFQFEVIWGGGGGGGGGGGPYNTTITNYNKDFTEQFQLKQESKCFGGWGDIKYYD